MHVNSVLTIQRILRPASTEQLFNACWPLNHACQNFNVSDVIYDSTGTNAVKERKKKVCSHASLSLTRKRSVYTYTLCHTVY